MQVILRRALPGMVADAAELIRPGLPPAAVHADELPPMNTVSPYRAIRDKGRSFPGERRPRPAPKGFV